MSRFDYTPEYHEVRMAAFYRDHWRCRWPGCGRRSKLTLHHIVFRAHGGKDELPNLATLCKPCHSRLHEQVNGLRSVRKTKRFSYRERIQRCIQLMLRLKGLPH